MINAWCTLKTNSCNSWSASSSEIFSPKLLQKSEVKCRECDLLFAFNFRTILVAFLLASTRNTPICTQCTRASGNLRFAPVPLTPYNFSLICTLPKKRSQRRRPRMLGSQAPAFGQFYKVRGRCLFDGCCWRNATRPNRKQPVLRACL